MYTVITLKGYLFTLFLVHGTCTQSCSLLPTYSVYTHTHAHTHTHTLTHTHTHSHMRARAHTHVHSIISHPKDYDGDAESLISGLQVAPDEDDLEMALKLAHIDIYNDKLRERQRRKA